MANKSSKFLDVLEQIGELKGKVDQMDIQIRARFDSLEKRMVGMSDSVNETLRNQTERIDSLEKVTANVKGKTSAISFIISTLTAGIIALFSYFKSH